MRVSGQFLTYSQCVNSSVAVQVTAVCNVPPTSTACFVSKAVLEGV